MISIGNKTLHLLLISTIAICQWIHAQNKNDIKIDTEAEFNQISDIFQKREKLYTNKKIKVKSTFIDTLFAAQKWAYTEGNRKQKLMSDYYVLYTYDQTINNDKIIELGNKLLAKKEFLSYPESSLTAQAILGAYSRKGYYGKQLELYPLFKKLNVKHNYNAVDQSYLDYYEIAMIYYNIENFEISRENFEKQAMYFIDNKEFFRAASMYNNIGLTYEKQGEYPNAVANYKKSLAFMKRDMKKDSFFNENYKNHFKNVVASNIASIQLKSQNYNGVEQIFLEELKSSKIINEPRTTVQAYTNLSEVYLLMENFDLCKKYIDSSLQLIKTYESPALLSKIYDVKAKYLLTQKEFKESHTYFLQSAKIKDSVSRELRLKSFEEDSLKFDLEITQEELEISKNLLEKKNQINILQWIILAITLIAATIFFTQFLRIKIKNKAITQNRKELASALKSNQNMLQEIHHRIKNNLQVISGVLELKSARLLDKESTEVIKETQKYIETMAYIHEHLYSQESESVIQMQSYLESLTNAVLSNYDSEHIEITVNSDQIIMQADDATPLGLIVCELVTNSAKHAFENEGEIKINLIKKNDSFFFHYQDNGMGYDLNLEPEESQIGINLVDMLIEELEAQSKKYLLNGFHLELQFD